jgi:Flp pilus assembly secretin CpaC
MAAVLFLAASLAMGQAVRRTDDTPWYGSLKDVTVQQAAGGGEDLVLTIEPMAEEQNTGDFALEDVYPALTDKGHRLEIVIDSIFPGSFEGASVATKGFGKCSVGPVIGYAKKPGEFFTPTRKPVRSTQLTLISPVPLRFGFGPLELRDSRAIVTLHLTPAPAEGGAYAGSEPVRDWVEVKREEFRAPLAARTFSPAPGAAGGVDAAVGPARAELVRHLASEPATAFVTVNYPVSYVQPAALQSQVDPKLSAQGTLTVNADTAMLTISDFAPYARAIVETLNALDTRPPQVMIEVRIFEVYYQDEKSVGVNLDYSGQTAHTMTNAASRIAALADPASPGVGAGAAYLSGNDLFQLNVTLDAMARENRAKLLARPRILALNNKTSSFTAGVRYPYLRRTDMGVVDQSTVSDTKDKNSENTLQHDREITTDGVAVTDDFTKRYHQLIDRASDTKTNFSNRNRSTNYVDDFLDVGVSLQVTPRILNSDEVTLDLLPSYTEIMGMAVGSDIPILSNRQLQSSVRVRDGETFLLGGLFREKTLEVTTGIPGLRSVPVLKYLFSGKREEKGRSEILFIIQVNRQP